MERKYLFIDFEYNQSEERHMGLVSVSMCDEKGNVTNGWLADGSDTAKIKRILESVTHRTMVCFNADAEARCFVALGLDPLNYDWIDLYLDYKQLQNKDQRYQYGRYVQKNVWGKYQVLNSQGRVLTTEYLSEEELAREIAIHKNKMALKNKTIEEVTPNLLNATANFTDASDEYLLHDANQKDKVRNTIIERKSRQFTDDERAEIIKYGESDIKDMAVIMESMGDALQETSRTASELVLEHRIFRGNVGAMMAIVASNGTPLSRDRLLRLTENSQHIENTAKAELNIETGLPLCQWELKGKTAKKVYFDKFVVKKAVLQEYIATTEYANVWPKGKTGYKTDSDTIEKYENVPIIEDYRKCQKVISAMKYTKPSTKKKVRTIDVMGSDGRLRCTLFPYSTQTARNAPKATSYIYAQGAWMKCLIDIPKGMKLVETDYSSQEFLIGGILAKDKKMIEAYKTDVYISFGVSAKQYPERCNGLSITEIKKLGHTDPEVANVRQKLKGVVLGLSYGAGAETISIKTGLPIEEVEELIMKYKAIYHKYYTWRDKIWMEHQFKKQPLTMPISGWYLGKDNINKLSTQNFPVQATGSTLLHVALRKILKANVEVVNTLHDAIYYLVPEDDNSTVETVEKLMLEAAEEVLGEPGMKIESESWKHGERVITPKGRSDYNKFGKFVEEPGYFSK